MEYKKLTFSKYTNGKMIFENPAYIAEGLHLEPWEDMNPYLEHALKMFIRMDDDLDNFEEF
jgi:hypothetical protein